MSTQEKRITDEKDTMQAIQVKENNGYYEIHPGADIEDWQDVIDNVDSVKRIEDLTGWPPYTASYRAIRGDEDWTYFVVEGQQEEK